MARVSFESLPDHGRLWVFPASRPLGEDEAARLLAEVDDFLEGWAAHGRPLRSARELVESRFLLVGVDVDAEAPSGCSIDALVHRLVDVAGELGITLNDHATVRYRDAAGVRAVTRSDFRALVERGAVALDTVVYDTTLTRVGDVRAGRLAGPAAETWHGRAFFGPGRPG